MVYWPADDGGLYGLCFVTRADDSDIPSSIYLLELRWSRSA